MANIYEAICGVMADIGSIQKTDTNPFDKYKYRGIDAVYNAVQPALVKNGVFIVPCLKDIEQTDRLSKKGDAQVHSKVRVQYTLYASDGSSITAEFPGEAIDRSDKSVNKAMTAAFKYMIFELFCIPTDDISDADKETIEAGIRQDINRDKLIQFCTNHNIDMTVIAERFGLSGRSTDVDFMNALSTLMAENTPPKGK